MITELPKGSFQYRHF